MKKNKNINLIAFSFFTSLVIAIFYLVSCSNDDGNGGGGGDPGSIMITEVGSCPYTNISSWFEVYNYTSNVAQLSDFQLRTSGRLINSPYTYTDEVVFSLPDLEIQPGSYILIRGKISDDLVNTGQIVYIVDSANIAPNWCYSGSGFVELIENGNTIDFVRFGSQVNSQAHLVV